MSFSNGRLEPSPLPAPSEGSRGPLVNHAFSHHLDHSGGCIHLHIFYVECRGIGLFILTHVDSFLSAKQNRFHITLKRAGNGQLSIIRFIINKNIGNIFPLSGKASPCQFNIQRIGSGSINGFTVFFIQKPISLKIRMLSGGMDPSGMGPILSRKFPPRLTVSINSRIRA